MSDTVLDKALKRREELLAELAEVERFIALYEGFKQPQEQRTSSSQATQSPTMPPHANTHERKKQRGYPSVIADEVFKILIETGRPQVRGQLAKMLIDRGFRLPPTDPAKYVGTVLWRQQDRFTHREGEGYWIKGRTPPNPRVK